MIDGRGFIGGVEIQDKVRLDRSWTFHAGEALEVSVSELTANILNFTLSSPRPVRERVHGDRIDAVGTRPKDNVLIKA